MGAEFITIELEVRASFELEQLCDTLGDDFTMNFCGKIRRGRYLLSGSLANDFRLETPNAIAVGLCELIEKLPTKGKKLWRLADDRVFDFGLKANNDPKIVVDLVDVTTVGRMAKNGLRLAVSIYPVRERKIRRQKKADNNSTKKD